MSGLAIRGSFPLARVVALARARGETVAWLGLSVVVAASLLARMAVATRRESITYLPDEYLYGQLARSIARGEGISVLGEHATFPALLQPLLTAPGWLTGDPELAFRFAQLVGIAAMSLAAVPVFLLARELGLHRGWALFAAAVAVVSPGLVYGGRVTADALGYLLALCATLLLVRMLDRPSRLAQAAFLAAAALAAFARVQYAVLLPVAAVAAALVERGRVPHAARRFGVLTTALAATIAVVAVVGSRALGRYDAVASFGLGEGTLRWLASTSFLLLLACGAAVAPGAVAWTAGELARPTSRTRLSFAAALVALTAALVASSAVMATESGSPRFFERYLLVVVPLATCAFGAWVAGGRSRRWLALAVAAALALAATVVPLSQFSAGQGKADSPSLLGVSRLEAAIGVGSAGLAVALVVTILAALGAGVAWRRRLAPAAAAVTLAGLAALAVGAQAADLDSSRAVAARSLGAVPGWVDRSGGRDVLLVQTPGSDRWDAMALISRNASVGRARLLGAATDPFDGATRAVTVDEDGVLRLEGSPVRGSVLVATGGSRLVLAGARPVDRGPGFTLYDTGDAARVAVRADGLRRDGWLAPRGRFTVYPPGDRACRVTRIELWLPEGPSQALLLTGPVRRQVTVSPGRPLALTLRASGRPQSLAVEAVRPRAPRGLLVALSTRATVTSNVVPGRGKETGSGCR